MNKKDSKKITVNRVLIVAEKTLFVAEYTFNSDYTGVIVRRNLETGQTTELYNKGGNIYGMAILDDKLLFAEFHDGIKSLPRDSSGPGDAVDLAITGSLESCSAFLGVYVAEGTDNITKL